MTEVCVVIWHKHDWSVAARVKYWSEGQPYLHLEEDLMVVPGATKYTARLLLYNRQEGTLHRLRDLVHTKVWVVGAVIGLLTSSRYHCHHCSMFLSQRENTSSLSLYRPARLPAPDSSVFGTSDTATVFTTFRFR